MCSSCVVIRLFGAEALCSSCVLMRLCVVIDWVLVVYWQVLFSAESVFSRCIMMCCIVFQDIQKSNLT